MKKLSKILLLLTSLGMVVSCGDNPVSSSEKSSSQSSEVSSSTSSEVSSTISSSSSKEESSSSSSEVVDTSNWDDCYMVGYGSYIAVGGSSYSETSGVKGTYVTEGLVGKEKYTYTVDLKAEDVLLFKLIKKAGGEVWADLRQVVDIKNNTEDKEYTDFFKAHVGANDIEVVAAGNYTFNVAVSDEYKFEISVEVNSFTRPVVKEDAAKCVTLGLASEIELPSKKADLGKLYKFEMYTTYKVGDEVAFKLTDGSGEYTFGYENIDGVEDCSGKSPLKAKDDFISAGADGKIHFNIEGGYTFYVNVKKDHTGLLWICCWNYVSEGTGGGEVTETETCYTSGLGTDEVKFDQKTPEDGKLYKFEKYFTAKKDSEIKVKVNDEAGEYVYGMDSVIGFGDQTGNETTKDQAFFIASGTDNKIHFNVTGGYTLYVNVCADYTCKIWINCYNYVDPASELSCMTKGLTNELVLPSKTPDAGKLYKFELYSTIDAGSEFKYVVHDENGDHEYGYESIIGFSDLAGKEKEQDKDYFISEGTDGKIKFDVTGGYTAYVNVLTDYTCKVWINAYNYTDKVIPTVCKVGNVEFDNKTPDAGKLYKFENYTVYNEGDEVEVSLSDASGTYKYAYANINGCQDCSGGSPERDKDYLISEGTDGKIKFNVKGGFTLYVNVAQDHTATIWICCWNYTAK